MIIGQEMAEIRHGGGCGTVPFLEFVRCGRFFGDCAPAKKVAILTSCNRAILNGQNLGAAGWGGGGGGAWCVGGVLEARRTQGTRQLEV